MGVDQQVGEDFSVSVMYVHRRTQDLLTRRITNLFDVPPGDPELRPAPTDGGRASARSPTTAGSTTTDPAFGAQALQRPLPVRCLLHGLARARQPADGRVGSSFSNNNHPEIDFGPSNQSVPHIFTANGLVVVPLDIHVSGIAFWRSGSAFNPRGIQDLDGDGLVDQRDTTQPRNAFRTKAYGDVDMRVEKRFDIMHRSAITVLLEAFNLLNRANVRSVTDVAGRTSARRRPTSPARELQVGVRYLFGRR